MPVNPTYPGVYIEEVRSPVRAIVGVPTSITAFIGRTRRGPTDTPVRVQNFGEFQRKFGDLWVKSTLSYAAQHYFMAGGGDAIIIRVAEGTAAEATVALTAGIETLTLEASSPGTWGNSLRATVDYNTKDATDTTLFNLTLEELDDDGNVVATESFRNLVLDDEEPRGIEKVLEDESALAVVTGTLPAARPDATSQDPFTGGLDGGDITDNEIQGNQNNKTGMYALEDADIFNLLVIPPLTRSTTVGQPTWTAALSYCKLRRSMLIIDPLNGWSDPASVTSDTNLDLLRDENAAVYYPTVKMADPLQENRLTTFAPSGVIAGVIARTDASRGVWKAPAGIDASLTGVVELSYKLTDGENGQLNPIGVNCLRYFPGVGNVAWGARTTEGADRLASEWKYVPVRRLALYIEESLFRGTQWVVFEPNDEPLWSQIRLNVGTFMHGLFRQGAFQGSSPREAYFVKCDSETTTQADIDKGIVNILVGFAPLKPAEFVIIKISQISGQSEA